MYFNALCLNMSVRVCVCWSIKTTHPFQNIPPCFNIKTDEDLIRVKLPNSRGIFFLAIQDVSTYFLLHLQILNS